MAVRGVVLGVNAEVYTADSTTLTLEIYPSKKLSKVGPESASAPITNKQPDKLVVGLVDETVCTNDPFR